jgi:hypothetical protein
MDVNEENYQKAKAVSDKINQLLGDIQNDTGLFSTHNHILNHDGFKELTSMGDRIIPYLFYYATHHGWNWVIIFLLTQITGGNPIPKEKRGSFYHSIKYWMEWFLGSKFIEVENIYHGLI